MADPNVEHEASAEEIRWVLEVPEWQLWRWRSTMDLLLEKPLSAREAELVQSFRGYLLDRGQLTARQLATLKSIADRHEMSLPVIPGLPVALMP